MSSQHRSRRSQHICCGPSIGRGVSSATFRSKCASRRTRPQTRLYHYERSHCSSFSPLQVHESSDLYSWVDLYLSRQVGLIERQTHLKLRLTREPANGTTQRSGFPTFRRNEDFAEENDVSLAFQLAEDATSSDQILRDNAGARWTMRVRRRSAEIEDAGTSRQRNGNSFLIELDNDAFWKFWEWGENKRAREAVENFIGDCRKLHEQENHNKLKIYTPSDRGGGWRLLCSRNKRPIETIILPRSPRGRCIRLQGIF